MKVSIQKAVLVCTANFLISSALRRSKMKVKSINQPKVIQPDIGWQQESMKSWTNSSRQTNAGFGQFHLFWNDCCQEHTKAKNQSVPQVVKILLGPETSVERTRHFKTQFFKYNSIRWLWTKMFCVINLYPDSNPPPSGSVSFLHQQFHPHGPHGTVIPGGSSFNRGWLQAQAEVRSLQQYIHSIVTLACKITLLSYIVRPSNWCSI